MKLRALLYTVGERPHVFVDTLNPSRVDSLHAFLSMHTPRDNPRIVEVEMREVVAAERFCAEEEG